MHPTPLFRRDSWLSLDGEWLMNGQPIRVPYPPEAPLSGWNGKVPRDMRYEKTFTLPEGFPKAGNRVILHFGAADQLCYVFLNGRPVVRHEGGYLPFQADVTDFLQPGENSLLAEVIDDLQHTFPYGKQTLKPGGMWYTPVSGLWQSVWLEEVPPVHVEALDIRPEADGVRLTARGNFDRCQAELRLDGQRVTAVLAAGEETYITVPEPRRWTPEDPARYELTLRCGSDVVHSWAALRAVAVQPDAGGVPRVTLNGRPVFLCAPLYQGYYPGGWFRPERAEDYEEEVRRIRALGFNAVRVHIKVEDPLFYEACDRLGLLVLQDMVQSGAYSWFFDTALPNIGLQRRPDWLPGDRGRRDFFRRHCLDTQRQLQGHPSVIVYTIFNEGWGQFHTSAMYRTLRENDPGRLYISSSGWFKGYETDLDSDHVYFRQKALRPGSRPLMLSECGGFTRAIPEHVTGGAKKYGYGETESEDALTGRILELLSGMAAPAVPAGLCGVVYTQWNDVEDEINGLYTFDRAVCKVNAARLREGLLRLWEGVV